MEGTLPIMSTLLVLAALLPGAISIVVPRQSAPNIPPIPENSNYTQVLCKEVNDTTVPGFARCATANCHDLMDTFLHDWYLQILLPDENLDDDRDFIEMFYNMNHGPENNNCNIEVGGLCGAHIGCGDIVKVESGAPITFTNPAAWLINDQIATFHAYYKVIYDSLPTSTLEVHLKMPDFANTFSPIDNDVALARILIGLFTSIATQFISTSVAYVADRFKLAGESLKNVYPVTASQAPAAAGQALAIGALTLSNLLPVPDPDSAGDSLDEILGGILQSSQTALRNYLIQIFGGTDPRAFREQFEAGAWLNSPPIQEFGSEDIVGQYRRLLYGSLIMPAWKLNSQDPIILYSDTDCDQGNPLTIEPSNQVPFGLVSEEDVHASGVCYAGKTFYLMSFKKRVCVDGGFDAICAEPIFHKLPGIETIGLGSSEWDGVSKDDLVASAWGGYVLNNYQEGYVMPEKSQIAEDGTERQIPFPSDLRTPGYIQAPLCKITDELLKKLANTDIIIEKAEDVC